LSGPRVSLPSRLTEHSDSHFGASEAERQVDIRLKRNLTTKTEGSDTWGYEWNAENDLTRVTKNGAEVARFAYDPAGRRVEKVAGGVTTAYAYDGSDAIREVNGTSTLKHVYGSRMDEPLAVDDGVTVSYFHADALGSIVRKTNASGGVTLTRQYDAWGRPEVAAEQSGPAFTGRGWEPEIGLYDYRFRWYDAQAGRFTSEDPIGFTGGDNFYRYVNNRPADFRDPLGLKECRVDNCLQSCLENLFQKKIPNVKVSTGSKTTFFMKLIGKGGTAISHPNSIRIPQGTSCYEFFMDLYWVAHEYYHVVEQWRGGGLTKRKYVKDPDRWEKPANDFADRWELTLRDCALDCVTCPVPD